MKRTDYYPLSTRIKGKFVTIQDVKHRENHSKGSFVHVFGDLAETGIEMIEQHSKFYAPGCFIKLKGHSTGRFKTGFNITELRHLLILTEPIAELLPLEITRRKLRGLGFCFEEISAIFSNLHLLANHLFNDQHAPKSSPKLIEKWISSIFILENFAIKSFIFPDLFPHSPIVSSLKTLSDLLASREEFVKFLETDPIHVSYLELMALTLVLENTLTLDKENTLTASDLNVLVSIVAEKDISQVWEGFVKKYYHEEYINQTVSTHLQKLTLDEMLALLDPNETNDPPIDPETYDEIRKKFSDGSLTCNDKRYPALCNKLDEVVDVEKVDICHVNSADLFLKNISLSKNLSELKLVSCGLTKEHMKFLIEAKLERLEHLDLSNLLVDAEHQPNIFESEGLNMLVESGSLLAQLKTLKLRFNRLNNKSVINLVTSKHASGLRVLDLGYNDELTNSVYHEIRKSKTLTSLEELVLSGCRLGDIGLYHLLIASDPPKIETIMDYQEKVEELMEATKAEITKFKDALANQAAVEPTTFKLKRLRVDVCSLDKFSLGLVCCSNAFAQLDELDLSFANLQDADYKFFELSREAKEKLHNIKLLNLRNTELKGPSAQLLVETLNGALTEELVLDENHEFDINLLSKIDLPKLRTLRLEHLARRPHTDFFKKYGFLENLTDLRLSFTSFDGVPEIQSELASRKVSKLKRCLMTASELNENFVKTLVTTPQLRDCYYLDLSTNSLKLSFYGAITSPASYLTNLKYLNLSGNKMTLPNVRAIWKNPALRQVEILHLSCCGLDGKALRVMNEATALAALDFLVLGENDFTLPDLKKYVLKLPKTITYLDVMGPKFVSNLAEFIKFAQRIEKLMKIKWFIPPEVSGP